MSPPTCGFYERFRDEFPRKRGGGKPAYREREIYSIIDREYVREGKKEVKKGMEEAGIFNIY